LGRRRREDSGSSPAAGLDSGSSPAAGLELLDDDRELDDDRKLQLDDDESDIGSFI
jgi:hypothetical protein